MRSFGDGCSARVALLVVLVICGIGGCPPTNDGPSDELMRGPFNFVLDLPTRTPPPPTEDKLTALDVDPQTVLFDSLETAQQLTVIGRFESGRTADLTSRIAGTTYASSADSVATITDNGLISAVGPREATIAVTNGARTASVSVVVSLPDTPAQRLDGLRVSPRDFTLTTEDETRPLTVTGTYSDGSERQLTVDPKTSYATDNVQVANVSAAGVVVAVSNGVARVRVEHGGFVADATVRVAIPAPNLVALEVSPSFVTFADTNERVQLRVRGRFSDGSRRDETDSADGTTYVVDDARVAAVTAFGELSPVAGGMATLQITNGALTVQAPIDVQFCLPLTPSVDPTPARTNAQTA